MHFYQYYNIDKIDMRVNGSKTRKRGKQGGLRHCKFAVRPKKASDKAFWPIKGH